MLSKINFGSLFFFSVLGLFAVGCAASEPTEQKSSTKSHLEGPADDDIVADQPELVDPTIPVDIGAGTAGNDVALNDQPVAAPSDDESQMASASYVPCVRSGAFGEIVPGSQGWRCPINAAVFSTDASLCGMQCRTGF